MNYNKNKKENIEIDDMKIKSHLNASLDLSEISVSEDLINRTLEAIKKQELKQQTTEADQTSPEEEHKKVIPWNRYARTFAGVAAAAIVVVAGYGLIKGGLLSSQKTSSTDNSTQMLYGAASTEMAEDSTMSTDTTAADSATGAQTEESAMVTEGLANAFTAQPDTANTDTNTEEPEYSITVDGDADNGGEASKATGDTAVGATAPMLKAAADVSTFKFRDIVLADPAQASQITITDATAGIIVTLTNQTEILDFYSVMEGQEFTNSAEVASGTDYTIEVTAAPDQALYTMTVGDHITVEYTGDGTTSQSLYDAVDLEGLKQALSDFCAKYNQ